MTLLAGARIVNTRSGRQANALDRVLAERGAKPIAFPCIEIAPPDDSQPLVSALEALHARDFDWIVFTSANAVNAVADRLGGESLPGGIRVAAIGDATAEALRVQFNVDLIATPEVHEAAGLAAELDVDQGDRVLLPLSSIASADLASGLQSLGAIVTTVVAYRTQTGTGGVDLAPLFAARRIDAIAFASPSAIDGFLERIAESQFAPVPAACIGRTTAVRARERGFQSVTTATEPTVSGLVDAVESALTLFRKGVS